MALMSKAHMREVDIDAIDAHEYDVIITGGWCKR